jgi:DNA polymerase-1
LGLEVHDDFIVEVPADEHGVVGDLVIDLMKGAAELDVPFEVDVSWGDTLAAAKG